MPKRDYIEEVVARKGRLLKRTPRYEQFSRRVVPLVAGYRTIKQLSRDIAFRDEWLKYGATGYVACVEGYFRLLFADLIDHGPPFSTNVTQFRELKFSAQTAVAVQDGKVTLGELVSHLLPMNSVKDINSNMSALLGIDSLKYFKSKPASTWNTRPIGQLFPNTIGDAEELFKLRHLYAHELATRGKVPVRKIEKGIGAAAPLGDMVDMQEILYKLMRGRRTLTQRLRQMNAERKVFLACAWSRSPDHCTRWSR